MYGFKVHSICSKAEIRDCFTIYALSPVEAINHLRHDEVGQGTHERRKPELVLGIDFIMDRTACREHSLSATPVVPNQGCV
jgi:hypothetical protein